MHVHPKIRYVKHTNNSAPTLSVSTYCSRNKAAVIVPAYLPPEFFMSAMGLLS